MKAGVKFALAKLLAELYGTGGFSVILSVATGVGRYGFPRVQQRCREAEPVMRVFSGRLWWEL